MRAVDTAAKQRKSFERCAHATCVSEVDLSILRFIGEQFVIDDDLLTRLRERSPTTNRRWRKKFRDAGLIRSNEFFPGRVFTWLTQKGLEFCGLKYRYRQPSVGRLNHLTAIGKVRLNAEDHLRAQGKQYEWFSERQLYKELKRGEHLPDGEVLLASGGSTAIEVELTLKRPDRMTAIFVDLLGRYDQVLAWCTSEPRVQLTDIVEENGWQNVRVIDYEKDVLEAQS